MQYEISQFYEDNELNKFIGNDDRLGDILSKLRANSDLDSLSDKQLSEICLKIRNSISHDDRKNTEINLFDGIQYFKGVPYPLDRMIIKIIIKSSGIPLHLYYTKDDSYKILVFLGEAKDYVEAILVMKKDDGVDYYFRLLEFHSLSISEHSTKEKAIGLMTSFAWINAKVHTDIIMGTNLYPIQNLLLSEGFRNIKHNQTCLSNK